MTTTNQTVQAYPLLDGHSLGSTIASLRTKKGQVIREMKTLREQMSNSDQLETDKISRWVELNKELRGIRIYEAEFCFIKNMI